MDNLKKAEELLRIAKVLVAKGNVETHNEGYFNGIIKMFKSAFGGEGFGAFTDVLSILKVRYVYDMKYGNMLSDTFMEAISQASDYKLKKLRNKLNSMYGKYEDELLDAESIDNRVFLKSLKFPRISGWEGEYDGISDSFAYSIENSDRIITISFLDLVETLSSGNAGEFMIDVGSPYSRSSKTVKKGRYKSLQDVAKIVKGASRD